MERRLSLSLSCKVLVRARGFDFPYTRVDVRSGTSPSIDSLNIQAGQESDVEVSRTASRLVEMVE